MEAEAASDGENHKRDNGEDNNDNNGSSSKVVNSGDGQSKPKRQMKTPFQLEELEKSFAGQYDLFDFLSFFWFKVVIF